MSADRRVVEARIQAERIEIWYAGRKVEELARLRGRGKYRVVNYRQYHRLVSVRKASFRELPLSGRAVSDQPLRMAWTEAAHETINPGLRFPGSPR